MAKSDDSKQADAAAAKEAGRLHDAGNPTDRREQLLDQLQGAAAEKREKGDAAGAERADQSYKLLEQALLMLERQTGLSTRLEERLQVLEKRGLATRRRIHARPVCGVCRQVLWDSVEKAGVCTGAHVRINVVPTDFSLWKHWQGVDVNGVRYIGKCQVPPAIVDSIKSLANRWMRQERQLYIPGGHIYNDFDVSRASIGGTPIIR